MRYAILVIGLAVGALTACSSGGPEADVGLPGVRDELLALAADDQEARSEYEPGKVYAPEEAAALQKADTERARRVAALVDEHGWLAGDLVGPEAASAAWVIVQHADLDVGLQERMLVHLRSAVDRGVALPEHLAYLIDRIAKNKGEPQTYGTQWTCSEAGTLIPFVPIADEANVDQRRAELGLGPLDAYVKSLPSC